MPRRSAAELTSIQIPGSRPEPPEQLSAAAREAWKAVAAQLPVERVQDIGFFLLAPLLATHMAFADELAAEANELLTAGALAEEERRKALRGVLKSHADQSVRIADLSTKLRLTSQSRYLGRSGAAGKGISSFPKPWEGWGIDPEKAS